MVLFYLALAAADCGGDLWIRGLGPNTARYSSVEFLRDHSALYLHLYCT